MLADALHHELVLDDLRLVLLLLLLLFILSRLFLQLEVGDLIDALDFSQGKAKVLASLLRLLDAFSNCRDLLLIFLHIEVLTSKACHSRLLI